MLFRHSRTNIIRGLVFFDSNGNGIRELNEPALKNIKIYLFRVEEINKSYVRGSTTDLRIFKDRKIAEAITDENGQYKFLVGEGQYLINLDLDSLPDGKGVLEPDMSVVWNKGTGSDFAVRDIDRIEIKKASEKGLIFGEEISLRPVLKDRRGNILFGRYKCWPDSSQVEIGQGRLRSIPDEFKNKTHYINFSSGDVKARMPLEIKIPDVNSIEKIRIAHGNRIIDEKEKILKLIHAVFNKRMLPQEYRSQIPIKSGTTAVKEISDYILNGDADEEVIQEAKRYLSLTAPELDRVYTSPGGYFNIHYTTSGKNAVPLDKINNKIPAYIEVMGSAFDNVKSITCESRGFARPVIDEGKSNFDIYVYDLEGKYGVTVPSTFHPMGNGRRTASCYICIDNNYSSSKGFKGNSIDCMKVTAAHEFFHAVQYAYNVDSDSWWKEASATWNEDEIYDSVNDYLQYLPSVFAAPEKSLEQNSYGGVMFAKYLSEKMGGYSMIKRIWEKHAASNKNSIDTIDAAIREMSGKEDMGTAFNRFTAYNFNPSQYYKEGYLWKGNVAMHNTYTGYPVPEGRGKLNHLSASYDLFKASNTLQGNTLRIVLSAQDKVRWGIKIQKRNESSKSCEITEIAANNGAERIEIICSGFGDTYSEVCLIPANLEKTLNNAQYSYSAVVK